MSNTTTTTLAMEQIADSKHEDLRRRWAQGEPMPQYILDDIAALEQMAAGKSGPVDPFLTDPEVLTWRELLRELSGWSYLLDIAQDTLASHFAYDAREAMYEAGMGDAPAEDLAGEQSIDEPADTPIVADLPPAKAKTYWLASEGQ